MTSRLSTGELERRVLEVMWARDEAMTPRDVHTVLVQERELAYTTVMTILVRLWKKGDVRRDPAGRAFAYQPVRSREEHVAERMRGALAAAADPAAALGHFVQSLDAVERRQLRRLLRRGQR